MQKIVPFLWFNDNAEEAVNFYVSVFNDSRIDSISRYSEAGPAPAGQVMVITFQLEGREFMALNGGPDHPFTHAVSLFVNCETQEEVDTLWDKLTADGGAPVACGWLTDKFGLSWQIIPTILGEYLSDTDPENAKRVAEAMFTMTKIDIEGLKRAYEGR